MKRIEKILLVIILTVFIWPVTALAQDADSDDIEQENEERDDEERERSKRNRSKNMVNFEFGLTNYLTADGKFPDATNEIYTLKPFNSVSVGLTALNETRILGPLHLQWGGNVTTYVVKFQDPRARMIKGVDGVEFSFDSNGYQSYKKSKLKTTYLNAMIIPMIHTDPRSSDGGFRFGAGVYGGYRIGSRTKVVFNDGRNQKDKNRSDFYINNLKYGVRAQIGWKSTDLFFTYDMSTLYQENRGPELTPFGFGIIF